ncbi:anaerobic ribonucleoside-triphosphate reductase activating protein [Permianibacter aggregans]|uniref:Pyruvate formate lyase activating enzyme n=1 Tax=Permianibacter aggregans TaxID=1510150 RepID=A0A4R6UAJ1_9GAMM|nr:anaerobic ribonucleoside-triphosphate reductase activating protein [Permianibacter aggregans]TDQ43628.1 pyruvate formate lyase activating enzyme [Permianibacter aggregans]
MTTESLRIGGYTPLTTIDYPGELAAVIFCQGCPWRCAYCHNPHLLPADTDSGVSWLQVQAHLQKRRGLLDAVVLSGGEPTAQTAIQSTAEAIKAMGFKLGLHTGGAYPSRLSSLLPLCDWVGFDLKTTPEQYDSLTATRTAGVRAWQSLEHIIESGVNHEVRITVHWHLLSRAQLQFMADLLAKRGVNNLAVQICRTSEGYARELPDNHWTDDDRRFIAEAIAPHFEQLALRA